MFNNTVTLYNYDKFKDDYYYTVFKNVEVQEQQRSIPDDTHHGDYNNIYERAYDRALLIIKYKFIDGIKLVDGVPKTFLDPKEWNNTEDKSNNFTFQTDCDFFIVEDNKDIKNVAMGNNVSQIGESAFENCKNLSGVTVGQGLLTIKDKAFKNN